MDPAAGLAALICGFLAGSVLFNMTARWVHAVSSELRANRTVEGAASTSTRNILAITFLHSAPWALSIAGYVTYQVLSAPRAEWWDWAFLGAAIGPLFICAGALLGGRNADETAVLTSEVLNKHRKRALWTGTLVFGVGGLVGGLSLAWPFERVPIWLALFALAPSMLGGYVFGLVMWQRKKAILESREYDRRKRSRAA